MRPRRRPRRRRPTPKPTVDPGPLLTGSKVVKLRFDKGDTVRFHVRAPEDEEVHIHGYDIKKDVKAGETDERSASRPRSTASSRSSSRTRRRRSPSCASTPRRRIVRRACRARRRLRLHLAAAGDHRRRALQRHPQPRVRQLVPAADRLLPPAVDDARLRGHVGRRHAPSRRLRVVRRRARVPAPTSAPTPAASAPATRLRPCRPTSTGPKC